MRILFFLSFSLFFYLYSTAQNQKDKNHLFIHLEKPGKSIRINSFAIRDSTEIPIIVALELGELHSDGYLFAFDSIACNDNIFHCYIKTGLRVYATNDSVLMLSKLHSMIKSKKYYSQGHIQSEREKIIKEFENSGYPFVKIQADSLFVLSNTLSFRYNIEKGNYIINDSIAIHGDKVLKRRFVEKYLQIIPGKPYCEKNYSAAEKKLRQLGFVGIQRIPDVWYGSDKAKLNVYLKKSNSNNFQGILGIVPPSGDETKTTVTGDLSLNLLNTFRNADLITLNWKKYDRYGQQLDVEFNYPYIFYLPTGVDLRFKLLKKDTSYITTDLRWGIPFYFQAGNHTGIIIERKSSDVLTENTTLNTGDYKRSAAGMYLKWNSFDRIILPRKGAGVEFTLITGKKEIPDISQETQTTKVDFFEQSANISYHYPISSSFGIKMSSFSGFISGSDIFMNEMWRLGGFKYLRGFDEESIYAQNYLTGNIEFKGFFGEYSNVFIFYNQAYYTRNYPVYTSDSPYGFGWGVELETPAGILSLVYALGRQFDNPVELRNSKVHISLLNRF